MAIPSILRVRKRTPADKVSEKTERTSASTSKGGVLSPSPDTLTQTQTQPFTKPELKRATRVRKGFALSASISYVLSFVFLVLV